MADYQFNKESRAERNKLPDYDRKTTILPEHIGPRPTIEFADEVRIVYSELMQLLLSKHNDYGPKNIADAPGGALNGLRVRMHDKLARINNLVDDNKNPEHESLEDSFKDMAN